MVNLVSSRSISLLENCVYRIFSQMFQATKSQLLEMKWDGTRTGISACMHDGWRSPRYTTYVTQRRSVLSIFILWLQTFLKMTIKWGIYCTSSHMPKYLRRGISPIITRFKRFVETYIICPLGYFCAMLGQTYPAFWRPEAWASLSGFSASRWWAIKYLLFHDTDKSTQHVFLWHTFSFYRACPVSGQFEFRVA